MDADAEHDDPHQEVSDLRHAFSQTTADVREHFTVEYVRQKIEENKISNHGSPLSSVDMKRASSVRRNAKCLTIVITYLNTVIIAIPSPLFYPKK
jgi:hypothetical protein